MNLLRNLLLLLLVVTFYSCGDDDANKEKTLEELIVGEWALIDREPHGIEICELGTTRFFKSDGDMDIHFWYGDDPEECENFEAEGHWEYISDNEFKFQIEEDPKTSVQVGFSDNNRLELTTEEGNETVTEFYGRL